MENPLRLYRTQILKSNIKKGRGCMKKIQETIFSKICPEISKQYMHEKQKKIATGV